MLSSLLHSARALPIARGALRVRHLAAAVELKGIGQDSDLQHVVVDGVTVIKMEPTGEMVGNHKNLPSLPPKMHIDWQYLMSDLGDDAKKEVFQVKAIIDRQQIEIDSKRAKLVNAGKVDWDLWATKLPSANGQALLAGLREEMDKWSFDVSAANKFINQYRDDLKEMESLVAAEKTKLEAEIIMLKEQSAALEQRMANVKSITIAELMEQDPEMAMEIEDEIRKDNWAA